MKVGKKIVFFAVLLAAFAATVSAGGGKESGSGAKVRDVVIGTGNDFWGFCFLDTKGELVGYELDVLRAVDELLPQYRFSFDTAEFRAILVGLDAGKFDLAAHNYAKNAERQEKYLYGKVPYGHYNYVIAVKAGRKDINSFKELEGKTVSVSSGSNISYLLENYNKDTAKVPIKIAYGQLDEETLIKGLEEGRFDAFFTESKRLIETRRAYNNRVESAGGKILPGYTYYIFRHGDEELRDAVDKSLETLRANGTLSKYSSKWFDQDYSGLLPDLEP
jgi:L-cystine transport system substrate-binding protein